MTLGDLLAVHGSMSAVFFEILRASSRGIVVSIDCELPAFDPTEVADEVFVQHPRRERFRALMKRLVLGSQNRKMSHGD